MKTTSIFWYSFISKIIIYCWFTSSFHAQAYKLSAGYKIFILVLLFGALTDVIYTLMTVYDYKHNFKK